MDKFRTVLNIANKQTNLGFGLVAMLTAGGEQIFSSAVFRCPCNELNFLYGMVFMLVPALVLLLLGYILSKKTWKTLTGLCQNRAKLCIWRRLTATGMALFQISITALVAPSSWIAVALLNGNYYECAITGTNVSTFNKHLCGEMSLVQCQIELYRFPCRTGSRVGQADREDVLLTLRAQSQILGWLVISSVMLINLLLICVARCASPISYLQLKFWRAYAQEEGNMFDSYITKHAKELAERNLKSFFKQTPPENIITPSNKDWKKISSLYKFSTKDHYYSTLHWYVENCHETDKEMMRMTSVKSSEPADDNPAVLHFVDDGVIPL
ncbi:calcium homeostasis modulator protein 6-like [Micropterus dolomieu]|uniref:calcium homeostasis modulator protein 6-like n=1 Tax=Micropterus dolomieu TaxID=147949 RepID=UPI001E8EA558|nr:calcium homeostasis modulator protein 6-like [Micropterus dolomieu]